MLKIYTKTGDRGETSLFGGKRVYKNDLRIEVLGEIDELNSTIGIAIAEIRNPKSEIRNELLKIQNDLFGIAAILTSQLTRRYTLDAKRLKNQVVEFEEMIDKLSKKLPEIKNFILPGGGEVGSVLHLARAICRRVERRIVALKVDFGILTYFNRLSDLLFVMARFVNSQEKEKEIIFSG